MIKSYRNAHRIAFAFLLACIATCALLTTDAAYAQDGRPVTLAQASSAPTFLSNLAPGAHLDAGDPQTGFSCHVHEDSAYFSDTSAYTWRGGALSGQHWNSTFDRYEWRDKAGKVVTFDGITFRNHTDHAVMVAGWCE